MSKKNLFCVLDFKENRWYYNPTMRLPENNPNFRVLENGYERLVLPERYVGNSAWKDYNDRWYRSLHTDSDGNVISCGFPKFMNLNEGEGKYRITQEDILKAIGKKNVYATLKMDGSLLIRYVHQGQVKWRTRGSFGVGLDNAYEIDYFMEKYPVLKDPYFAPMTTLLFEWVSPENKIIISYDEPEIYLIGCINDYSVMDTPYLSDWPFTLSIAQEKGFLVPEYYKLNNQDEMDALLSQLNKQNIEGFVIRIEDHSGVRLVKLKTEQYKTLHALKSKLTTSMLVDLWLQWNKPDFSVYKEKFIAAYDFECFEWAHGGISNMYEGIKIADKAFGYLVLFVETKRNLSRKEFALMAQQAYNGVKLSTAFALLDGQEISNDAWKKLILQNCKQVELTMFDQ